MCGGLQGEVISFMEVTAACQTVANLSELEISKIFPLKKRWEGEREKPLSSSLGLTSPSAPISAHLCSD